MMNSQPLRRKIYLLGLAGLLAPVAARAQAPDAFQAKALVALSDADMIPSAYINGQLGPAAGTDALTVAALNGRRVAPTSVHTLPISNSVTGPPAAVTVTPDGRYAITIETRGPRPVGGTTLAGLPSGRTITVVDLADPQRPRVVQQLIGPARALSVSVSADGTLVALAVSPDGDGRTAPLWLYRFGGGRLAGGVAVPVPGWVAGHELVTAVFHPTRPLLALTDSDKSDPHLLLAEVLPAGAGWQLRSWGNTVPLGPGILLTCFSPDGRYFFANGGPAPAAPTRGQVLSVRLGSGPAPVHTIAGRALTGFIPEGLAVSPDGRLLVTTNLEHTYEPVGSPARGRYASLSLLVVDPATGALTSAGDFAFDGQLNESAVFDSSSRRLAVANFGQFDDPTGPGSLDFWRVTGDVAGPAPLQLVQTRYSLPLPRGVHTLSVVR